MRALTTLIVVAPAALVSIALIAIATITSRGISERLGLEIVSSATDRVTSDVTEYLGNAVNLSDLYVRRMNDDSLYPNDLPRWKQVMFHDLATFTDVASICFSTPNGDCTWLLHAHGRLELGIVDGNQRDRAIEYPADITGKVDRDNPIRVYHYDATRRPWFQIARAVETPVWTPVYFWFGEQGSASESGTGYTRTVIDQATGNTLGVLVIDVTLGALSEHLRRLPIAATGYAFIVDDKGLLVAASDSAVNSNEGKRLSPADSPSPAARAVASLVSFEAHGTHADAPTQQTLRVFIGDKPARVQVTEIKPFPGIHWHVVTVLPETSFLSAAKSLELRAVLLGFGAITAGLAAGLLFSRKLSRPLVKLADHVGRVGAGDFDSRLRLTGVREFERLSDEVNRMAGGLKQRMMLESAITVATQVQQGLLPTELPRIAGLDIALCSKYCDSTGGDYYDFVELPACDGRNGDARPTIIAVGDVTGHGIGAALVMATARGAVRSSCHTLGTSAYGSENEFDSLGHVLSCVNQVLTCGNDGRKYMTLALLMFEPARQVVRWSSAGHDPTIVYHPDTDTFDELHSDGIPLGIDPDLVYRESSRVCATPGTFFVIGTDGIWEARNADGEMFGKERLCGLIRSHSEGSAEDLSSAIKNAMWNWVGPRPLQDDVTFVIVRIAR